jgi:DNA-binding XRE family transcriptional regulator/phage shock protein A
MGYRLQMSGEVHDWLADLRDSDPPAAILVGQALTAVGEENGVLRPPLVISLADSPGPAGPLEALDRAYQERLDSQQILRRLVADVVTLGRDIERQIADLQSLQVTPEEQHQSPLGADLAEEAVPTAAECAAAGDLIAELRRLLPGVIKAGQQLTETSRRRQIQADAFRTRKETLKAVYGAARAEQLIEQAWGRGRGDGGVEHEDSGSPVAGATARLQEITDQIEQELRRQVPAEDLMELRPGAPGDSGIRILFAIEPPGTALLIAVLEGHDTVRDHYRDAVTLSAAVLQRVRAAQAPEATAHTFGDTQSFLDEFFPGNAEEVRSGATALAARNRARTLAEQRTRLGLTQAQVAQRMGVRQERVSAIERAEPGATEVRTLASYVEALGGRLDITADFGAERVLLR